MGLADRDYIRTPSGQRGFRGPGSPKGWSFNTWLIVINVAVFVAGWLASASPIAVHQGDDFKVDTVPTGKLVARTVYGQRNGSDITFLTPAGLGQDAKGRIVVRGEPKPAPDRLRVESYTLRELYVEEPGGKKTFVGYRIYKMMDALTAVGHFSTAKAFFWKPSPYELRLNLEVWRLVTFQFLHAGFMHIGFNMFGLYIFGRIVEQFLGFKRYAAFYLMCGITGGLTYLLLNAIGQTGLRIPGALFNNPSTPLVGASAGVFGVIMASAFIMPNSIVQLIFPPIPLKMKFFAYGYVALAAFNLFVGRGANQGGDAAHLGGAAAGFFFIRRPHLLRDFFDVFQNSSGKNAKPGKPKRRAQGDDAEIDRILDKIQREGIHSLTPTEKRKLNERSESRRG